MAVAQEVDPVAAGGTVIARAQWRAARLFEAKVRTVLSREGCSFMEWMLMRTLYESRVDPWEGVPQVELAERTGLSRQVVSYWLIGLEQRGVVHRDEGDDGVWGALLTEEGTELLLRCDERLARAGLSR